MADIREREIYSYFLFLNICRPNIKVKWKLSTRHQSCRK